MKPDADLILESRTAILPFLSLLRSSELFELTSLPLSSLSVLSTNFSQHEYLDNR